ncbi:FkbM family methyltransferase [Cytophagaceae bacterium YF14B1]|uniref:FkbM family methyltransferase n=1 Tax=Xanthocytophaga flava TaxID=3048013 RepID=A0AAE3QMN9_9BACT|nr:FkbM family methyltransferase [Xanthocytophaga flavus]MDJ1482172.1 FkbM family methyltransferase [Xanthocytophaga flavus]
MKSLFLKLAKSLSSSYLTKKQATTLIKMLAKNHQIDLLLLAYNEIGILKYENAEVSGENFFLERIVKSKLQSEKHPVVFDVGANIGKYVKTLADFFPSAEIYAFEPNFNTYQELKQFASDKIKCINAGLGSKEETQKIYTYANQQTSSHATLYKEVLTDLHRQNEILELDFQTLTLDNFCSENNIERIHLLKIDTEGHEMEVLKGAKQMIQGGKIDMIQFEFNEMNIISRVFLKDFYEALTDYTLHRIDSNRLIPLPVYYSLNEIFQFQNFVAIYNK